ncbi:MFS transporter [Marinitenerispora sediminis]|uniref:MFS transporter n=1 Tax=Marinitenerispora sediminis TaxID=1931232 RepID=A0A368TAA2_9ACTN|nr:MFS transporter [Marinitenerispora sediminis]RCV53821.1 MFS transporter [Marinitenerispora sediminis]RCV58221.1 MFS transporter [Marinitenerispora sediminis]RCV61483.1 MFS transporter [Marinitenerispora sediminis]
MLRSYRRLLDVPHLPLLLFWSLFARLHVGGLAIAVTFLVAGWTGSYALAGVVAGGLTIGTALAGPMRGRMADTRATDRLMLMCGLVFAGGLLAILLLPARLWWLSIPLAVATGLFQPPASQIGRALWPRITTGPVRDTMYATEATLQELLFIVGPLLAAATVGLAGAQFAVGLMAAIALIGSVGFAVALRRTGLARVPDSGRTGPAEPQRRSLMARPPLALIALVCLLLAGGLGAVDLVIVAWARELGTPGLAGGVAAVWAAGSAIGGLTAGALAGTPRLPRRAFAAALGLALVLPLLPPLATLPSPWLVAPGFFVAGLAIAPTLAAAMTRLGELAPEHRRAEAFGWLTTATTTGVSLAAPLAGWLVDTGGPASGVAGATVLAAAAAVLTLFVPGSPARPGSTA